MSLLAHLRAVVAVVALMTIWVVATASGAPARTTPVDLRCEYLQNPLGLDVATPRLSWRMAVSPVGRRDARQTAYQVMVASDSAGLNGKHSLLWDSGRVTSSQSVLVDYRGPRLHSEQECWWKVRIRDERGRWSGWSKPARWSMGLLNRGDWKAHWIGATGSRSETEPWLKKEFDLPAQPVSAVIHVASVGYHELYVNGKRVGQAVLTPSVSDYTKRARYRTYEIGPFLRAGKNVIGLWLGPGWCLYPTYQKPGWPAKALAFAQASITLPQGKRRTIATDASWSFKPSPAELIGNFGGSNFGGERFDSRQDDPSWCEIGDSGSGWAPVAVVDLKRTVSAEYLEPDRVEHVLHPVGAHPIAGGGFRIDMGRNYAGWLELPVVGKPGDVVSVEFSEREDKEETYGLRSEYVIGPGGRGLFCNRFNYGSGRWITVRGLAQLPPLTEIRGLQIRSGFARTGGFECSDPLLNWVYDTTLWTFENLSLGGYVVDCPQRERRGYGGDAHSTTQTGLDNFDLGAFYTKWSQDWRDVQSPDGDLPYTAPTYSGGGGPAWSGFSIHLPWKLFEQYGDVRILRENFPTMQRWLAFMETHAKDGLLVRWGQEWDFLGDWLWPYDANSGDPDGDRPGAVFFNNCYWAYALETAAKIGRLIGEKKVANEYAKRAETLCRAIHARWFHPATHDYANGRQNHLAMALLANVPPPAERASVWKRLEEEVLIHRKGHIDAGIVGGALLTRLLIDDNRADLMYEMATKRDYPSWGYFQATGQTTIPESWDNTNSQLHSSYLFVGAWFIEGLAGIRPGVAGGYQDFLVRPLLTCPLHHASAHFDGPYGRISVAWTRELGHVSLTVEVPANSHATVVLPAPMSSDTGSGPSSQFQLGQGVYHFSGAIQSK